MTRLCSARGMPLATAVALTLLLVCALATTIDASASHHASRDHHAAATHVHAPATHTAAPSAFAHTMVESEYQAHFVSFVRAHSKKYTHDEFFPRFAIFKANFNLIRQHNAKPNATFSLAVNEYADLTFGEFHSRMTGYRHIDRGVHRKRNRPQKLIRDDPMRPSLDWRAKGMVTPVKNQQSCGSCWAFSATGAMEGAHAIKNDGELVGLSEQQLVDCSSAQGNLGCRGGLMDQAFQYVVTNGGIANETDYPYTALDGKCNATASANPAATISTFVDVKAGSEEALMAAVNLGPVSIAIEADQPCFQFYSTGVLTDSGCGSQLDHGVLLVGYDTDKVTHQDYWIVKNSWGGAWGEKGYIRLVRGKNECGLADAASYPIV